MTPKELRSRRISLGLTVPELARELDLTTQELEQMEDGVRAMPPHEVFSPLLDSTTLRVQTERWRDCLVVEDDESVRQLFAARLRAEGLTVDEAEDGLAAVDATTRREYRLMLLDLKLPKLSGAEVLERVAKKPAQPPNVVVISGADSSHVHSIANHSAVHAILRKGFAITNADVIFPALAALART